MSLSITDLEFYQQDLPAPSIVGGSYYSYVAKPVAVVQAVVDADIQADIKVIKGKHGLVGSADATAAGAAAGAAAAGFGPVSVFVFATA